MNRKQLLLLVAFGFLGSGVRADESKAFGHCSSSTEVKEKTISSWSEWFGFADMLLKQLPKDFAKPGGRKKVPVLVRPVVLKLKKTYEAVELRCGTVRGEPAEVAEIWDALERAVASDEACLSAFIYMVSFLSYLRKEGDVATNISYLETPKPSSEKREIDKTSSWGRRK